MHPDTLCLDMFSFEQTAQASTCQSSQRSETRRAGTHAQEVAHNYMKNSNLFAVQARSPIGQGDST
jgi:hypothetical protein